MLIDSCCLCQRLLWKSKVFCGGCWQELLEQPLIHRQDAMLDAFSMWDYSGPVLGLVRDMKRGHWESFSSSIGQCLAQKFAMQLLTSVAGVIPMPASIFGSHDHAYLLAKSVARFFDAPLLCDLLERGSVEPQKQKTFKLRHHTRIVLRKPLDAGHSGIFILVDDVITTGATLLHAWRALGSPPALGLTLASTPLRLL